MLFNTRPGVKHRDHDTPCTKARSQMRNFRHLLLGVAICGACIENDDTEGLGDPPIKGPDFEVRYQTKYVDIAPGFTQPVCRGSLDEIDRHIEAVADLLNIEVEGRTTLFLYNGVAEGSMADNNEICSWCSSCAGCFNGPAHATYSSLHHELVHAVVVPAWGRSDTLFEEGIAKGMDRDRGVYGTGITTIYDLDILNNRKPSDVAGSGQHGGAHFSRWLVDRFGTDKFREMFDRLTTKSTKEEVFAAVEAVYGLPFEELEAEYYATAPLVYPLPGLCEGLVNIPWNGDRWELNTSTDCDEPHMFGPAGDGGNLAVVTIDVPPEYVDEPLAVWVPSNVIADVWPCIDEPMYDVDPTRFEGGVIHNNFGPHSFRMPGRHRIEVPVYESGTVYLRLCPDKGSWPLADPTVDPENCLGD